jgi:hypothetical protein
MTRADPFLSDAASHQGGATQSVPESASSSYRQSLRQKGELLDSCDFAQLRADHGLSPQTPYYPILTSPEEFGRIPFDSHAGFARAKLGG